MHRPFNGFEADTTVQGVVSDGSGKSVAYGHDAVLSMFAGKANPTGLAAAPKGGDGG